LRESRSVGQLRTNSDYRRVAQASYLKRNEDIVLVDNDVLLPSWPRDRKNLSACSSEAKGKMFSDFFPGSGLAEVAKRVDPK